MLMRSVSFHVVAQLVMLSLRMYVQCLSRRMAWTGAAAGN